MAHLVESRSGTKLSDTILATTGIIPLSDYKQTLERVYSEKIYLERLYIHERAYNGCRLDRLISTI